MCWFKKQRSSTNLTQNNYSRRKRFINTTQLFLKTNAHSFVLSIQTIQDFSQPASVLWPCLNPAARHFFSTNKMSRRPSPIPPKNPRIWLFTCNSIGWGQEITDCVTAFFRGCYCGAGQWWTAASGTGCFLPPPPPPCDSHTDNMSRSAALGQRTLI